MRTTPRNADRPTARPDTNATGNPALQYSRDAGGARYAGDYQGRKRRKNIRRGVILGVVGLIVVALIALVVWALVFVGTIGSRMNQGVSDETRAMLASQQADARARAASSLTEAGADLPANWEDTTPFYMLLLGVDESLNRTEGDEAELYGTGAAFRSDTIILARIDPGNKQVTLVSIHRDTWVNIDGVDQKINAAYALGGVSKVIEVVSQFAGVPISHYAEVDIDGLAAITDAVGGVEVTVPYEINDLDYAGYLPAGTQVLNGEEALIFTRSRHAYDDLGDGDRYRAANQRAFLAALANKLLSSSPTTMVAAINALSQYVTTDLTIEQIAGLALTMQGIDTGTDIYSTMNPTENQYINGQSVELSIDDQWHEIMAAVDAGERPMTDYAYIDPLNDINSDTPESDPTTSEGNDVTGTTSTADSATATDAQTSTTQATSTASTPANPGIVVNVKSVAGADANAGTISELSALGYTNVEDGGAATGLSAGGTTYVVYEDDACASEAQAIADAIGGIAIDGEGTWVVAGDVMVVTDAE